MPLPVLLYVGSHFAEKLYEQKAFGIEVLKHVIKKYPRSAKVKKAAKKELQDANSNSNYPAQVPVPR